MKLRPIILTSFCLVVWVGTACGGGSSASTNSATSGGPSKTRTYAITGMSITVPAEWTKVNVPPERGVKVIYLEDPGHPTGAVTFSVVSGKDSTPLGIIAQGVKAALSNDQGFSRVNVKTVTLPAGQAVKATSTVTRYGRRFDDTKYVLSEAGRVYAVTFMVAKPLSQEHTPQIAAAARSIRFAP